jgi:hypothetical protein
MRCIKVLGIFTWKRGQQYKLGLDATTVVHGKNDKSRMGGYFILEYDRDIYKNIDYLSGSVILLFGVGIAYSSLLF